METIGYILMLALDVFFWIIILQVVLSWLIVFEVINVRNAKAANLIQLISKITDPVYKPLRKYIPSIAGIDITPIIIIFGIQLIKSYVIIPIFF